MLTGFYEQIWHSTSQQLSASSWLSLCTCCHHHQHSFPAPTPFDLFVLNCSNTVTLSARTPHGAPDQAGSQQQSVRATRQVSQWGGLQWGTTGSAIGSGCTESVRETQSICEWFNRVVTLHKGDRFNWLCVQYGRTSDTYFSGLSHLLPG